MSAASTAPKKITIAQALLNWRMVLMFFLGVSSGIPLLLTGSTLQAWMKDANIDLKLLGLSALFGLPYTVKFLWSPFMDRYVPPFLGRRRGWAVITQGALILALINLGFSDPARSLWGLAFAGILVAFCSASQDIVLDAFRREILREEELGLGSTIFINGYRIGMLLAGAGALFMADRIAWREVYFVMAGTISIGLITILLSPEPASEVKPPKTLQEAVVEPFKDYFQRRGAFEILIFIFLYKIGDTMASAMTTPFVLGLGFTKTQFAAVAKTLGLAATIGGGFVGGLLMVPLGINRSLWIFGLFQMLSILSFVALAQVGQDIHWLAAAVVFENASWGMGTSAYSAYMASITNRRFTATQYALLSSLMGVPRVILAAPSGWLAEKLGWTNYFFFCTAIAIPGMFLLIRIAPWKKSAV